MNAAPRWPKVFAASVGTLCAVLGLLVLAGWCFQNASLVRLHSGFGPMQPQTALGILLCGASLAAAQQGWRRVSGLLAGLVLLLGLFTCREHIFGAGMGVGPLLSSHWTAPPEYKLGRMAPGTAVCLSLMGGALLALAATGRAGSRFCLPGLLSLVVCAVGLTRVMFYLLGIGPGFFRWMRIEDMAVHTGLAFIALPSGLFANAWGCGSRTRQDAFSRWLPLLAGAAIVLASWTVWRSLEDEDDARVRRHMGMEALNVKDAIRTRVLARLNALLQAASRWSLASAPTEEEFALEAQLCRKHFQGFHSVAWADGSAVVRWVAPLANNEAMIGYRLSDERPLREALESAAKNESMRISGSVDLLNAGRVSVAFVPVVQAGILRGFLVGVIHLKTLLGEILTRNVAPGCWISVLDGAVEVYTGREPEADGRRSPETERPAGAYAETRLTQSGEWKCRVWPGPELQASLLSFLPTIVLCSGHLLAVLLALTLRLSQTTRRRAADLLEANQHLESEVAERRRAEDALTKARDELEVRVGERTAELSSANAELLSEVVQRKRAQEERERLLGQLEVERDRLAEADRRKNEFLAILGHELRNPLAPIRNAVTTLRLRASAATQPAPEVDILERQVALMTRLVDDLLDVARITRGKIELRKARVDLRAVVRMALAAARPLIDERRLKLAVSVPPGPVELEADAARLEQALANILNNAAKYTGPGGRVTLTVESREGDALVRVRDSGVGIRPGMLERIFEPFTQADPTLERTKGGLGIGLTVVRSLVEMHGGRVSAHSKGPGMGSELIVRLPLLEAKRRAQEGGAEDRWGRDGEAAGLQEVEVVPMAARRVFIVDDNVDSAKTLAVLLELWGHEVRIAHEGESALEAILAFGPHVVLLDLEMQGMNGYQVARRLRESGLDGVELVALTGYGQKEDRRRSAEAGFDIHVVKPVDPAVLKRLVAGERERV